MRIYDDRIALLREGALPHHAVCVEIGVNEGGFASLIAEHTNPAKLHLIDVWAGIGATGSLACGDEDSLERFVKVSRRFTEAIKQGRAFLHQGLSVDTLAAFADSYFDWAYVDGDHSYQGVLADLRAVDRKVKPGGIIAGHDFCTPQAREKVRHYFPGVYQAVVQFCQESEWEWTGVTRIGPNEPPDHDGRGIPSYVLARK